MKQQVNALLTKLQKFTRIDLRYLLSGGFFLSLNQVSSALIGLVMTIAFANLISPEAYGTYKYAIATYSLFALAALPGIDTAVLRAISKGHDKSFTAAVRLKAKWSLLGGIAALIYALYNFATDHEALGLLFVLIAVALPFMETGTLFTSYFNAKKLYKRWTLAEIAIQIFSGISLLTTLLISDNIVLLMAAYLLPYAIARVFLLFLIIPNINTETTEDTEMQKYSASVTIFQILSRLITSIDQIVLFHFIGPASVAIFSIANSIPTRIKGLLKITGTLAFPKLAQRSGADIYKTLPRKMFFFSLIILGICLAYVFIVPILFTYIFPKYHDSIAFSQVLVFFTLSGITYPFSSFLFAHMKIKENYILAVLSFLAKVVSLFILVPLYGIWGAVVSVLAAAGVTIGCTVYFLYAGRNEEPSVTVANDSINE
jgi:O-antigen/teichoic acid export membrane protein